METERKVVSPQERMQKGQSHLANIRAQLARPKGGIKKTGRESRHWSLTRCSSNRSVQWT